MIKLWIMTNQDGSFWKEYGTNSWSKDIPALLKLIKQPHKIRHCQDENETWVEWK